jgi:hypothetical protein
LYVTAKEPQWLGGGGAETLKEGGGYFGALNETSMKIYHHSHTQSFAKKT